MSTLAKFRPPPSGVVVSWRKSRVVAAVALLPSGEEVDVPAYDAMAAEVDASCARRLDGGLGWGVHWLPPSSAARVAAACVTLLDADRVRAERDAGLVVAGYACALARGTYTYVGRNGAAYEHRPPPADGWCRELHAPCDPVTGVRTEAHAPCCASAVEGPELPADAAPGPGKMLPGQTRDLHWAAYCAVKTMHTYGDAALAIALVRRGKVVLYCDHHYPSWRVADVETATLALVAEGWGSLLWTQVVAERSWKPGRYVSTGDGAVTDGLRTLRLAFDRVVDVTANDRAAWAAVVKG